jgi:cytochrome b subunit of formate dehydrogenase
MLKPPRSRLSRRLRGSFECWRLNAQRDDELSRVYRRAKLCCLCNKVLHFAVWFVAGLCFPVGCGTLVRAADAVPDADCLQCHGDRELTRTNAAGGVISLFVDAELLAASRHGTNTCVSCHAEIGSAHPDDRVAAQAVACARCHAEASGTYGASAHGRALRGGQAGAATCKDCHGTHAVLPRGSPASPLRAAAQLQTCGACHPEAAEEVRESVHGQALAANRRDAPTCTDCHSEHRIETLRGASSIKIAGQVCSRCHASERINTKYHLPSDRVKTFLESYHGLAAKLGSTRAANCASCHGVHRILPSTDPRSTIHQDHLVETCGRCHPGANENFALSRVHVDDLREGDRGALVNRWVRRAYQVLIGLVIGVFVLHNGLLWFRKAMVAFRSPERSALRMSRAQRIQHALLAVSFIVLAVTGFALKFPDSWVAWMLGSDESVRRWSHRGAALGLMALALYHLLYVRYAAEGRQLVRDLMFRMADWTGLKANLRYMSGRSSRAGEHARFSYAEKIEYWSLLWGTAIMGGTGLLIWFPVEATRFLPRWMIEVATTIHYYEAILACLAILVWHFYQVIFDPDVYPLNWACWDGRATAPPASHHGASSRRSLPEPAADSPRPAPANRAGS